MNRVKECSYCKAQINTEIDSYFTCEDNYLQVKYFDTEEENVFCNQECFCNYVQLEEIEQLIKYLENKIEKTKKEEKILRERRVPKFYDIGINVGEKYAYQTVLEKVRSGKYE